MVTLAQIRKALKDCDDIKYRSFSFGGETQVEAALVYVDGLTDGQMLDEHVLKPLMEVRRLDSFELSAARQALTGAVKDSVVSVREIRPEGSVDKVVDEILTGDTAFLVEGAEEVLLIAAFGWGKRAITDPKTEVSIRGPFESFIEDLRTNTGLVRRHIKSPNLKMKSLSLGAYTKTRLMVAYVDDLVMPGLVDEIWLRLSKIQADEIFYSENIEEYLEDNSLSLFPQIERTERPDKIAAGLMEGRAAILVDTTPFAMLMPTQFFQMLQSTDDYTERPWAGTFVRIMRLVSINIALLLPSLYIAIVTYHQEMLPTPLLLSIAGSREGIPFPALIEALLMELTFELLREAGVRLPRQIGQAVSIVGALVIGQAAVQASLVSPLLIIVVALTGIASFTFPAFGLGLAIRMLRFPLMLLAASFGLFGVLIGLLIILVHLCSLRSFGVPYLSPLAPISTGDLKDVFVRVPWWAMFTRPRLVGYRNPLRRQSGNRSVKFRRLWRR